MVWRLPHLRRTLKSLRISSQKSRIHLASVEDSQKRYEQVRDLARKRLDRAEMFSQSEETHRQFG